MLKTMLLNVCHNFYFVIKTRGVGIYFHFFTKDIKTILRIQLET